MSNKNTTTIKCPDCNCPPQITMEDIIKAVLPGNYTFNTFKNINNISGDRDITLSETDRWDEQKPDTSNVEPYNPSAQGIMPYSDSINDMPKYNLDNSEGISNLNEAINLRIDEKLLKMLRLPEERINGYENRGNNSYTIGALEP